MVWIRRTGGTQILKTYKVMKKAVFITVAILMMLCNGRAQQIPFADTTLTPVTVIRKARISQLAANNLSELLRYELNVDIEQYPADGGARPRAFDLDSRYFKVLVNGIPAGGSDMFGGHADISGIPLGNVDSIQITTAPSGTEYGSGTLAGVINIVTHKVHADKRAAFSANIQEESAGDEYNLRTGNYAKGRRLQYLAYDQQLTPHLSFGISGLRNAFAGRWGPYNGKHYLTGPSYQRGFEWSPYTSWNGDGYISWQRAGLAAFYTYSHFYNDLTFYGHDVGQEFAGSEPLPLYSALDYRYVNNRSRHHLHFLQHLWKNALASIDLSYQDGRTERKIVKVNAADNKEMEDAPLVTLYNVRTFYAKGKLVKPLLASLTLHAGFEMDRTSGYIAAAPGTYQSRETDRVVFTRAGFSYFRWQIAQTFAVQPGMRISSNGLSKAYPSASLAIDYQKFNLILERVYRFPNHRELFTFLENDLNLLTGNEKLKPETGYAALLSWQNRMAYGDAHLQLHVQTAFRQLKDRIVIASAPGNIPTQDAFQYANVNKYCSWANKAELTGSCGHLDAGLGFSYTGQKGNDFADAGQYNRYLFHAESNAFITYKLKETWWIQANHRFVGSQPIYSFERNLPSPDIIRVYNKAPSFNILDINIGKALYKNKINIGLGLKNLFDVHTIDFNAADGQEHYRGDLRTMYIGYGRSVNCRLALQL